MNSTQGRVYKTYLLCVLLAILGFNLADRLALGLLLQNIKLDLKLTDTQLGFLSGIAFALFYSVMGIPIARWADRGDRVKVISVTTVLWSGAVALCGFAGTFVQLLLIRIGVAIGEAGCMPPSNSLISDYFARAVRPRATAVYMLGGPLSVAIGCFAAGWLNEFYGWRTTFKVLALPGLGLAALAWWTLQEPRRGTGGPDAMPGKSLDPMGQPSLSRVAVSLWTNRTFRHLLLCWSVASFFAYGIGQWQPTYFIRTYGLETGQLGTWFAVVYGIGGLVGTYLGGEIASRYAGQNESLQLKAIGIVYACFAIVAAGIYLSTSKYVGFTLLGLGTLGTAATTGPLLAAMQTLVPQRMRAMSIAVTYLFANLIGMGLGPLLVGILSDVLRSTVGNNSLRYTLIALCPGYFWAAWHSLHASKTVAADLAKRPADLAEA